MPKYQRLTFELLQSIAARNGWAIERNGRKYEYWRVDEHGVGPTDGTEHEAQTLAEAYSDIGR